MSHSGSSSHDDSSTVQKQTLPTSWEAESVMDYGKSYARKFSEFRDDQATVWTSMYEKNLGRKVSQLPPWAASESGRKESEVKAFGDPFKKDLASVHMERAQDTGALRQNTFFPNHPTAKKQREKRKAKRTASSNSTESEGSYPQKN